MINIEIEHLGLGLLVTTDWEEEDNMEDTCFINPDRTICWYINPYDLTHEDVEFIENIASSDDRMNMEGTGYLFLNRPSKE